MKDLPGILVAVTGASGAVYAQRLIGKLNAPEFPDYPKSLVFSPTALRVWEYETGAAPVIPERFSCYRHDDVFAPPASGSAGYGIMIICPCSMGTLGRIASGVSDDLITRAADVMLKEKRQLILVPREMPYNLIHLRNMEQLTLAGAVICPASPSFYSLPASAEALIDTVTDKLISLAGLAPPAFRWQGI